MKRLALRKIIKEEIKAVLREDYRDAEDNIELLKKLINDPSNGNWVIEQLLEQLSGWDGLDEFVELMLDDLAG